MIYPWQQSVWESITTSFLENKLSHAVLFSGIEGLGKSALVMTLVRFMLCEKRHNQQAFCVDDSPCHACRLIQTNVHPNVYCVAPEKAGQAIKIDHIRDAIEFVSQSAYMGQYQCVVIESAQQLNVFAANALLKTLEEPPENVFFFLIASERSRLPATVLSRVMQVQMPTPAMSDSLAWLSQHAKKFSDEERMLALKIALGAPLKALAGLTSGEWKVRAQFSDTMRTLHENPARFADSVLALDGMEMPILLDFFLSWAMDLIKIKCGMTESFLDNPESVVTLQSLANQQSLHHLDCALHRLIAIRRDAVTGIHLNKTLSLEVMLMNLMGMHHVFS